MNEGKINDKYICGGSEKTLAMGEGGITGFGIRPLVVLKKGITLTKSTTDEEGNLTWHIE